MRLTLVTLFFLILGCSSLRKQPCWEYINQYGEDEPFVFSKNLIQMDALPTRFNELASTLKSNHDLAAQVLVSSAYSPEETTNKIYEFFKKKNIPALQLEFLHESLRSGEQVHVRIRLQKGKQTFCEPFDPDAPVP